MTGPEFSGVRVVARGGSVLAATCTGFADIDAGREWTRRTKSQVASVSKQFAAVVALVLVDQGVLTLADQVASVLTDAPAQWQTVTVQHLLTHTSGLSHWDERPGFGPQQVLAPSERLALLLEAPLSTPAGARWKYSSPGYIVLSAVLEAATQRRYAELVEEHIIRPLGLTDTTVGRARVADAALGYQRGEPVPTWDLHLMPGTGDIWSTADDIVRFVAAVHEGTLLPERIQPKLHAITVALDDDPKPGPVTFDRYGLGHFVGTVHGQPAYLHPGDNPGYKVLAAWMPATQTTAIALSNNEMADVDQTVADLLQGQPER